MDTSKNSNLQYNPVEEAYKVLRSNIQFNKGGKKIKTISVTSFAPNEGKTTTSINLAAQLVKSGLRVLYVDADLRKPMLMKQLQNENMVGLSNYLLECSTLEEVISVTDEGLFYLPSGVKPLNPAELVGTPRFSEFLNIVKEKFDIIIIDTPPIGCVIDSAIISAQTDATLIVIQPNTLRCDRARMMREQLDKANVYVLGVVFNKVRKDAYKDTYGDYDYYGKPRKYAREWLKRRRNGTRGQL